MTNYESIPEMIFGQITNSDHDMAVWLATGGVYDKGVPADTKVRPGCFVVRDAAKGVPMYGARLIGVYNQGVRFPDLEDDLRFAVRQWKRAA